MMPNKITLRKRSWQLLAPLVALLVVGCGGEVPESPAKQAPAQSAAPTTKAAETPAEEATEGLPKRPKFTNNCSPWLLEYGKQETASKVKITTRFGDIVVKLYDDTPVHRANFLMLVRDGYFSETLFHRVEQGFIAQGGKGDELHESWRKSYGEYLLPANLEVPHFHKRGALAAARKYKQNPEKRSSPFDYYLVQGSVAHPIYLDSLEQMNNYNYSELQREVYTTIGGAPHLDGEHTVFGEIVEGLSVLDNIGAVATDRGWWPKEDIFVEMEVVE